MSQWSRSHPEEMERISHLPVGEQQDAMRAAVAPLIERGRVVQFSARTELAKERAARVVDGTFNVWKVAHGSEGFALDLSNSRCAFCGGAFAPVGWAFTFHDQYRTSLAVHAGCYSEAALWAGREFEPDWEEA